MVDWLLKFFKNYKKHLGYLTQDAKFYCYKEGYVMISQFDWSLPHSGNWPHWELAPLGMWKLVTEVTLQ